VFVAIFFAGMWASLAIADRIALNFSPLGPEDELVRRYRNAVKAPHPARPHDRRPRPRPARWNRGVGPVAQLDPLS